MRASVAERCKECNSYCQHLKETELPVQKTQKDNAKCLILLGPKGQKMREMGLTVELGSVAQCRCFCGVRFKVSPNYVEPSLAYSCTWQTNVSAQQRSCLCKN